MRNNNPNCNTLENQSLITTDFGKLIIPKHNTICEKFLITADDTGQTKYFNIGRKGFLSSHPISNLNIYHLQKVDANLVDWCAI